jgi:predicted transcriptional regulator
MMIAATAVAADLATASGVCEIAIKNIERGATDPRVRTVNSIQEAFDRAGVIFVAPSTSPQRYTY